MTKFRVLLLVSLFAVSSMAFAQENWNWKESWTVGDKAWNDLEKHLEDVNNQWVCATPKYHRTHVQDCVVFKNHIWPPLFFEISSAGEITDKAEMVKRQTARNLVYPVSPEDAGPNPQDFKLRAVYGNVALATDRTVFKAPDATGKVVVTNERAVLRVFVRLDGKWVPATAALVDIAKK